jgi:hypothetical protein
MAKEGDHTTPLLPEVIEKLHPNPDKPEITNYKHPAKKTAGRQITNKFQIIISKSQIRSKINCLEF